MLTVAAPIAVGLFALHRPPFARFGSAAAHRGLRVVPHHPGQRRQRDALQHRAGRLLGVRAAADLPPAGVPDRSDRPPPRPGAGLGRGPARADPLPADGAVGRALSGAERRWRRATSTVRRTRSWSADRSRRSSRTSCARCGRSSRSCSSRRSPCGSRSASAPRPASRAARSRPCWPWPAFAARPSARPSSGGGSRRSPASLEVSMWLLALAVPLTALAFLAGFVRWWVFMARSTQRLVAKLRAHPTPEDLRLALAEAFDDPSLAIVYWLGDGEGHWGDADGHRLDPPSPAPGRAVTKVLDGDRLVATIVHDSALQDERAFVDTATSYAVMTFDHHRLTAETSSLLRAVRRLARAHPDRRGRRAPAHRARPARRRAAAAHRAAHQARARRRADERRHPRAAPKRPPRCDGSATTSRRPSRRSSRSRAGSIPSTLADYGLARALRSAALQQPASHHGPGGGCPAPLTRDRERRVLLLPRSAPERGQARARREGRR